jgi:hypothetical protein
LKNKITQAQLNNGCQVAKHAIMLTVEGKFNSAAEQGISRERYMVIPRVLVFLLDTGGNVLLIRGAPTKRIWANKV